MTITLLMFAVGARFRLVALPLRFRREGRRGYPLGFFDKQNEQFRCAKKGSPPGRGGVAGVNSTITMLRNGDEGTRDIEGFGRRGEQGRPRRAFADRWGGDRARSVR